MKKLLSLLVTSALVTSSTATVLTSINNKTIKENYKQNNKFSDWKSTWDSFKNIENRANNHSEFKPTGYYLKGGISYLIYLNKSNNYIDLVVGQWEKWDIPNSFSRYAITGQTMWITPVKSGMLYIADNNQTDLEIINITSNTPDAVIKVPTFKVNETNQTTFIQEIWATKSPFIEFKSKHYFATMQTKMILNEVLPYLQRSFNETLLHWDNVWNWTNEVYGLIENSGINKKSSQYIHIANADSCLGYANAADGRIMFHNEQGAGKDLFLASLDNQWGLWHETGHTYQAPQYTWEGLSEVTVNISALYIQQKMNFPLRIFEQEKREATIDYLNNHPSNKDFNKIADKTPDDQTSLWIKLSMFWQLQMGFGENFYPLLNQRYREINQEQNPKENLKNIEQQIQNFIKISSEVSGYNLASFFKQWGLNLTWETENEINKYKVLTQPIWNNIVDWQTSYNPIIQEKLIYKSISDLSNITARDITVNFGEDLNNYYFIQKLFNVPNSININDLKINTFFEPLRYQGQYYFKINLTLTEYNKRPNSKIFNFKVNSLNNTINFKNNNASHMGIFGLDPKTNHIKFYGNTEKLYNYHTNHQAYNIEIKTNTGVILKNIAINYQDSFDDIIKKHHLEDGIKYFDNYQITITQMINVGSFYIFNQNDYQQLSGTKIYRIQNNTLIEIY